MTGIPGLISKYRTTPGERFFTDIFESGEYRPVLDRHNLDTVIDVGALAGEFSAYIYDRAKTIYALEPYPSYFAELESNVKEFELYKIKPMQLAITGHDGTTFISKSETRGGNKTDLHAVEGTNVPCLSIGSFIKREGIEHVDVLKIDIENTEDAVFLTDSFKEVASRIDCVVGEHISVDVSKMLESVGLKYTLSYKANVFYEREQPMHPQWR